MNGIRVYAQDGREQHMLSLDQGLAQREISTATYAQTVRALLQNWRQGTVASKGRSDVAFSRKKPWRQKGTGRARVGSLRSPLWRKGGVIFGPQPRTRVLEINRKQHKGVLNNMLFELVERGGVHCVDFAFEDSAPRTKLARMLIENLKLGDKKVLVLIRPGDDVTFMSFRNIPNVRVATFDQPNAYDFSNATDWLFLKKDVELFNAMVAQWN
jgi:large subunit ribosomal protein L4